MWQGLFKRPPDTDIKLDPHQRDAIERLEKLHPDQHGLILFHFLGSGKTITALSFAPPDTPTPCLVHLFRHILYAYIHIL